MLRQTAESTKQSVPVSVNDFLREPKSSPSLLFTETVCGELLILREISNSPHTGQEAAGTHSDLSEVSGLPGGSAELFSMGVATTLIE